MVPAGAPTEDTIGALAGLLEPGDLVVDGGNSNFRDTVRRASRLRELGLELADSGTWGASGA
jgi:6-phosphogluconate dehydrogenase